MTDPANHSPLCWLDIETTGLDVGHDLVLEVGMILTDGDLLPWRDDYDRKRDPLQLVIVPDEGLDITTLDSFIVDMHSKSGLLADISSEHALSNTEAQEKIHDWLKAACVAADSKLLMAGSTVGQFDRQFFKRNWPGSHMEFFEYRNVDVSSFKEIALRWYGKDALYTHAKKLHRVLPDIDDSIAELRHFRSIIFRDSVRDLTI